MNIKKVLNNNHHMLFTLTNIINLKRQYPRLIASLVTPMAGMKLCVCYSVQDLYELLRGFKAAADFSASRRQ